MGDVFQPEPRLHLVARVAPAVFDQGFAALQRFEKILGGMVSRIGHQMHTHAELHCRFGALVQETVHVHHRGGAAFQCFHVTHQKAVVGIGFGQYAVLALVLRQPVHQLGIFGIALQQAGMRMHIDQPR